MNKSRKTSYLISAVLGLLLCLALGGAIAQAEDVVLRPGYISGTVTIEGITTSSIYVYAYAGNENANTYSNDSNYNLTVNVPEGGSIDYSVYAYAYSGNNNYLYFSSKTVPVSDGATSILDFAVIPGTVNGKVTLSGATINYGYVYANSSSGSEPTNAQGRIASDGTFSFPAQPNTDIYLSGNVYDTNGNGYPLTQVTGLSLAANGTLTQNWDVEAGNAAISGQIALNGAGPVNYQSVYAYGPMSANDYRDTNFGNYALTGLLPGDYLVYAGLYFNNYDDYFFFPYALSNTNHSNYNYNISVPAGGTVAKDIVANARFINGFVSLSGSKGIADLSSGEVEISGIDDPDDADSTYGGNARDGINTSTGAFDLVASPGKWALSYTSLNFYNWEPANYLFSYMYISDYNMQQTPFDLEAQEVLNNVQLNYATGTVTVNYSIDGGGVLSSPRLNAYGQKSENNQPVMAVSGYAYGPSDETETGTVTFVGVPMLYELTAYAYVGGSETTFGRLNVEILPGTDIVVDIGGPTLTISTPAPETYTTQNSVDVSGLATDDQGIASITVNGDTVSFYTTNNAGDPNEVSFSTSVILNPGPNSIQTVATDNAGKTASDTRKVYLDASAPTLDWTPADGAVTTEQTVMVAGTATDDVAISEIRVNGELVGYQSSGNSNDPNEVEFNTIVSLVDDANDIVVSAKDSSNRITSQTHTIEKNDVVMVCDADGDGDVDRADISLITAARNTPATGPDDPRDSNGDGIINVLDARGCTLKCTLPRCQ